MICSLPEESFTVKFINFTLISIWIVWYIEREKKLFSYRLSFFMRNIDRIYSPVIIGGSTTVDGPKNDGISLDVVTGVFKSPVC